MMHIYTPSSTFSFRVLRMNNIKMIEYGAFTSQMNSIEEIQLQRNELKHFPTLTPLNRLNKLDLSFNDIETMGPGTFNGLSLDTLTTVCV